MKKFISIVASVFVLFSCASKDLSKLPNDEMIDGAARNLKKELLKNYPTTDKKVIAISSFARMDLISKNKKYSQTIPKLGVNLANSLQNEMFEPRKYDLVERTRLDSIFEEYMYTSEMPVEKLANVQLKGVDYILLGTFQKREKSIRIDARLVSVENGKIVSVGTTTLPLTPYTKNLYEDYPDNVQEFEFTIYAYKDWQMIPFEIKAPAEVEITAKGSWGMTSDSQEFGADGIQKNPSGWGDYRIIKQFNHGQILTRLSSDQNNIGTTGRYTFNKSGFIECIINDNDRNNNVGAQIVKIKVKSITE